MKTKAFWKLALLLGLSMIPIMMVTSCTEELDIAVCAPDAGPFSLDIDNEWFPLTVGQQWILEGPELGKTIRLEVSVLDETEEVAGVTTRVLEEAEYEDDELVEISRNYFVQAPDDTVCYYGEWVDIYEEGEIVSHEGSWRADEGENLPGIFMPSSPEVGMQYQQEVAPGVAEDKARIMEFGESLALPAGQFDDTMRTHDWAPPSVVRETKYYARGIGLIVDARTELISY